MKRINENQKVTLTLGQLKKLINESKNVGDSEWFRRDVESSVSAEFHGNIYDLRCYYDGDDSFINKRDFVIEGNFGRKQSGHYSEEKSRLYAAIRKAGGTNIIGRVFTNGGFDVAFDIQEKKLAQYRQEKADEMAIVQKEVDSFDISKYKPSDKILAKIQDYKNRHSKVNVKAIKGYDKLLTYYWAAAAIDWNDLMRTIYFRITDKEFFKMNRELGVYTSIFPEFSITQKLKNPLRKLGWLWGDHGADGKFILSVLEKIKDTAKSESGPAEEPPVEEPPVEDEPEAPVEVSESTKITLTIGQIKKLIKESMGENIVWNENLVFTPEMIDDLVNSGCFEIDFPKLKDIAYGLRYGDFSLALRINMKPANVVSKDFWITIAVDTKVTKKFHGRPKDLEGHWGYDTSYWGWDPVLKELKNPSVTLPDEYDYDNYALPFTRKTQESILTAMANSHDFEAWLDEQCQKGLNAKLSVIHDYDHMVASDEVKESVKKTYIFLFNTFLDALRLPPQKLKRPEVPSAQDVENKREKDRRDHEEHERQFNQDMEDYYADAARTGRYTGD